MKKSKILLAALALVMILTVSIGPALAYFYASAESYGRMELAPLTPDTEIHEDPTERNKEITIENTGEVDVFVRVKALASFELGYAPEVPGDWEQKGEFYEYTKVLPAGQETSVLHVTWSIPALAQPDGSNYNVVVVYEAVPALGETPDWTLAAIVQGGGQG